MDGLILNINRTIIFLARIARLVTFEMVVWTDNKSDCIYRILDYHYKMCLNSYKKSQFFLNLLPFFLVQQVEYIELQWKEYKYAK